MEAMFHAASTRMRPLLMTSLSACIGLFPAAISTGIGSRVQRPLATVIVGGMLIGPFMLLIVVPAPEMVFDGRAEDKPQPKAQNRIYISMNTARFSRQRMRPRFHPGRYSGLALITLVGVSALSLWPALAGEPSTQPPEPRRPATRLKRPVPALPRPARPPAWRRQRTVRQKAMSIVPPQTKARPAEQEAPPRPTPATTCPSSFRERRAPHAGQKRLR